MEITLSAYEKKTINFSGGFFTALSVSGDVELSAKGIEDIPIETGDQISLGAVPNFVLQNITANVVVVKYATASKEVNKKSQVTKTEIINALPIKVQFDDAFTVGAVAQSGAWSVAQSGAWNVSGLAAKTAGDPIVVELAAGQSAQILPVNNFRSSAIVVRGELDLLSVKLAYNSALSAQNGIAFAPQSTVIVKNQSSLWAHNNSGETQTIIAIDSSIN